MFRHRTLIALAGLTAVSAGLLLFGCQKKPPVVTIPEGPVSVTGFLKPVPLSLVRRGTHVVVSGGSELYFVQSSTVPLSRYEESEVTMSGTLALNSDPADLPVLTVTGIESHDQDTQPVHLASLGVRFEIPRHWSREEETGTGSVHFASSGSLRSVLSVSRFPLTNLPEGSPVIVDSERGVRVMIDGSADQIVYVLRMKVVNGKTTPDIISFTFTPGNDSDLSASPFIFQNILRSVRFSRSGGAGSSISSGTGSGIYLSGQPCGGSAGILCPSGFYCSITDVAENIGVCVTTGQ
ncbi:hypothetical protein HZA45_00040 [Candidatus Peregrinibacteria bacterium]|nr:hypothetical protein [Candidatus Peregrinibacteria bacterium]